MKVNILRKMSNHFVAILMVEKTNKYLISINGDKNIELIFFNELVNKYLSSINTF